MGSVCPVPRQLLEWGLVVLSWLVSGMEPGGGCAPAPGMGRERGVPAVGLAFGLFQPLFLSCRLPSALPLPSPDTPAFSFTPSAASQLPASPLTNGAHPSHHHPTLSGEHGPSPTSTKKKQRKQQQSKAGGSSHAIAVNGCDEGCSPPRKRRNIAPEGSIPGKEAAGTGREERDPHGSPSTEPISSLKKKKRKRRLQETEERSSGAQPLGR